MTPVIQVSNYLPSISGPRVRCYRTIWTYGACAATACLLAPENTISSILLKKKKRHLYFWLYLCQFKTSVVFWPFWEILHLLSFTGGYYLTSAYGALSLIKNFQEEQAARLLSSETRDTLRQWHKRRTTNRTIPSVDDFQVELRAEEKNRGWSPCSRSMIHNDSLETTKEVKSGENTAGKFASVLKILHFIIEFDNDDLKKTLNNGAFPPSFLFKSCRGRTNLVLS